MSNSSHCYRISDDANEPQHSHPCSYFNGETGVACCHTATMRVEVVTRETGGYVYLCDYHYGYAVMEMWQRYGGLL